MSVACQLCHYQILPAAPVYKGVVSVVTVTISFFSYFLQEFTFDDLFGIDIDSIDDAAINDSINLVNNKYVEKGASGSIAKSPAFINDVDAALNL